MGYLSRRDSGHHVPGSGSRRCSGTDHNADEIRDILGKVANSVPEKVDLTLDVTHGFRHFPFVFYALVLYLKSLRGVNVRGAYYGLVEGVSSEQKPILDLQPLLDLPEWFYAVRMFREHGTPLPIRDLIEPLESVLREEAHKSDDSSQKGILFRSSSSSGKAAKELGRYAFAYGSALPLELGRAAKSLANPLNALSEPQCQHLLPPLSDLLIKDIVNVSDRYSIKTTNFTGEWKRTIVLDECELARQARMIDSYLDRGQIPLAVGLMREWVVSWMMFKDGTKEDRKYWIEENRRRPFEYGLGELLVRIRDHDDKVSKEQKEFGTFWTRLTIELRNALHHHGMRPREIANPQGGDTLDAVRDFWGRLSRYEIEPPK